MAAGLGAAHATVQISDDPTKHMKCTGGICSPTASHANLNAGDLLAMLAQSDVTVKATAAAPDIGVLAALTWTSTYRLTLDAYESIHIRAPIVVEGTSGMTLTTNDGGTRGDYTFNANTAGSISFWDLGSSLVINGKTFTLVGDIQTLASDIAADSSGSFALANSYDASADGTYRSSPIYQFAGTFEGLGNAISNLKIVSGARHAWVGLFGVLLPGGAIRDINLAHADVAAPARDDSTGALVGGNMGAITAANVSGRVTGRSNRPGYFQLVGGLAAVNGGTIMRSSSSAAVTGKGNSIYVGGLVGGNQGDIVQSRATGPVTGGFYAGGLVAVHSGGTISQCYATGNVLTDVPNMGAAAGGLIGLSESASANAIQDSYSEGTVTTHNASDDVGGLVGVLDGSSPNVSQTFATGGVAGPGLSGGYGGQNNGGQFVSSYWNTTTSGKSNAFGRGPDNGVSGLTDDDMKSGLPEGFDPAIWAQKAIINSGWPYLIANPPQ
jgi:hypothetical protein